MTTNRLEQAQWDYDRAVLLAKQAEDAAIEARAKISSARDVLEAAKRKAAETIPVDRTAQMLTDGSAVPEDRSHTEIGKNGQQKGYIVLTEAERAKGFVRPYRDAYRHSKCGAITTMSRSIAETYARDPHFYNGTFCSTCRSHYPIGPNGEFTWFEMDGTETEKVGT